MGLENASLFLESHESHVEEGKSCDFGYAPHKVTRGIADVLLTAAQGNLMILAMLPTRLAK